MTGRPRVTVVGGGLAGMAAALECADRGADVTLVEGRKWLGGATASFVRDGMTVDTGQHVFLRCCTAYRAFLARLGVEGLTSLQPRMAIPVLAPGRASGQLRRGRLPAPLHLGPALARYPFLTAREKAGAVRTALALRKLDPADPLLDRRTFGSWLAERGQSERSVRYLWDLFGLPSLNLRASEASLALAVKVFQTGLLERSDAADVGVPLVPLAELHGGPARRALAKAGATVRLGTKALSVRTDDQGATGVIVDDGELDADVVILAAPWDRVDALLPPAAVPEGGFGRLGTSPIVNVHIVYDRRVCTLPFAAVVDSPVQWVFDRTGPAGLQRGQYLAISLSGADDVIDRPVGWFRETFVPELSRLFPGAAEAVVERFLVTKERAATFRQAPGTASLRPGPETNVPRLFLAGAWTDTKWPATMEGAVRSGVFAADATFRALAEAGSRAGVAA